MNKIKYILLLFFLQIFGQELLYGQQSQFKHFGVDNGLIQTFASTISQDKYGNLWIGSHAGVSKFDGKEFYSYTIQDGLASQFISSCLSDDPYIWFGHQDGGLSKLDIEKETFTDLGINYATQYKEISTIIKDNDHNLWIGTRGSGIVIITKSSSKVIAINTDEGLCNNNVNILAKDNDNNIWCGTDNGISLIKAQKLLKKLGNSDSNEIIDTKDIISKFDNQNGIFSDKISSLFSINEFELLVGTSENGLIICNPKYFLNDNQEINEKHIHNDGINYHLNTKSGFPSNKIKQIIKDNNNIIWISTEDKGIIKLDYIKFTQGNEEIDKLSAIKNYGVDEGLSINNILALYCDRENNLWIGSWLGLDMLERERFVIYDTKDGLESIGIASIYEDKYNNIWLGTFSGLSILTPSKIHNEFYSNTLSPTLIKNLNNVLVLDIIEDKHENLWLGTNKGLYKFNKRKNTTTIFNKKDGLPANEVNTLVIDNTQLWVGTNKGVCKVDINTTIVSHFSLGNFLDSTTVDDILIDSKKRVWFGLMGDGLAVYDEGKIQLYGNQDGIDSRLIRGIVEDLDGNIWIASLDRGVYRFKDDIFTNYGKKDGMQSETGYLINCDNDNNIWVGSNIGVDKINTKTNLITSYGKLEGFKGYECNLNATCIDHLGNIWFGTMFGAVKYNAKKDIKNELEPKTKITNLHIFNEEKEFPKDGIFEYDKNYLAFKYIGVSLTNPKKVMYQYQLVGFDPDWSPETDKTEATYSFLPPGNYTFNVRACNNDGVWNKEPASYSFTILTPFWKTWWFINLCVFAVFGGFFSIYKFRLQSLRQTRSRLEETVKERTRELNKQKDELEKLSIVASNTLSSVVILNELGEFEWVNKAFENNTEYSLDAFIEAYGNNILDIQDDDKLRAKIAKAIEKKQPLVYDAINISKSGKENWMQTNLTPIVKNGDLKKIVVIDTDISEMKKAESDIRLKGKEIEEKNRKLNEQKDELEKLSIVARETDNYVIISDKDDKIEWVNAGFTKITGYSFEEVIGKLPKDILRGKNTDPKEAKKLDQIIKEKKSFSTDILNYTKSGNPIWLYTNVTPVLDDNGNIYRYISLGSDITAQKEAEKELKKKNRKLWEVSLAVNKEKEEVEKIKLELEEKNKHITDSINYAQNIQEAILPTPEELTKSFKDHFVLFKPKDVVSGDFYWHGIVETEEKEHHFIAAVDCTGHGVPGAFMSMIGHELLNTIIYGQKVMDPGKILNLLRDGVRFALKQDEKYVKSRDGMDMALCKIDIKTREIEFCGAVNPVWIFKKGVDYTNGESKPEIIKGSIYGVGGIKFDNEPDFKTKKFKVDKGDTIYIASDGYMDQFGGPKNKRLRKSRFLDIIGNMQTESIKKQKEILDKELKAWQGKEEQIDDIMVIGIRL
ncbi:MAG: hypothetical protein COC01_06610 [Bacteroidetes bacterium]|nr:MAG: hypothetical protein COC01_06610 [Bacteroidota bacterium]